MRHSRDDLNHNCKWRSIDSNGSGLLYKKLPLFSFRLFVTHEPRKASICVSTNHVDSPFMYHIVPCREILWNAFCTCLQKLYHSDEVESSAQEPMHPLSLPKAVTKELWLRIHVSILRVWTSSRVGIYGRESMCPPSMPEPLRKNRISILKICNQAWDPLPFRTRVETWSRTRLHWKVEIEFLLELVLKFRPDDLNKFPVLEHGEIFLVKN